MDSSLKGKTPLNCERCGDSEATPFAISFARTGHSYVSKHWRTPHAMADPLYDRYVDGDLMAQKKTENLEQVLLPVCHHDVVVVLATVSAVCPGSS